MLPSSALRNCTVVKYISLRPHLAQVCCVSASVLLSSAVRVWTADLFARRADGNVLGLDSETMVLGRISGRGIESVQLGKDQPTVILVRALRTFVASSADAANHDLGGIARRLVEQVAAVVAEDQGPDGRHYGCRGRIEWELDPETEKLTVKAGGTRGTTRDQTKP